MKKRRNRLRSSRSTPWPPRLLLKSPLSRLLSRRSSHKKRLFTSRRKRSGRFPRPPKRRSCLKLRPKMIWLRSSLNQRSPSQNRSRRSYLLPRRPNLRNCRSQMLRRSLLPRPRKSSRWLKKLQASPSRQRQNSKAWKPMSSLVHRSITSISSSRSRYWTSS